MVRFSVAVFVCVAAASVSALPYPPGQHSQFSNSATGIAVQGSVGAHGSINYQNYRGNNYQQQHYPQGGHSSVGGSGVYGSYRGYRGY
ncbi:hypothetical protein IWQ61_004051 [Dispira simplex]|nr:hypothetical protein IWQ61_004051 [Dispira simplex]